MRINELRQITADHDAAICARMERYCQRRKQAQPAGVDQRYHAAGTRQRVDFDGLADLSRRRSARWGHLAYSGATILPEKEL